MFYVANTFTSEKAQDGIRFEGLITGAKLCIDQVNKNNHYSSMIAPECNRPLSDYIYSNFSSTSRMIILGNYTIEQLVTITEKQPKG